MPNTKKKKCKSFSRLAVDEVTRRKEGGRVYPYLELGTRLTSRPASASVRGVGPPPSVYKEREHETQSAQLYQNERETTGTKSTLGMLYTLILSAIVLTSERPIPMIRARLFELIGLLCVMLALFGGPR